MIKIYSASAGSGKTFNLTREYLKIVVRKPEDYRHILAVTFTNKATEEMKSRILGELDLLASGGESMHLDVLCNELKMVDSHVREQAGKALQLILFNYSAFTIFTIDRFFQQLIKAFAWEIGVPDSLNLELGNTRVLSDSIRHLYEHFDQKKRLRQWMLEFSTHQIESGDSWNLRKSISKLGEELFKENFQQQSAKVYTLLENEETLQKYLKMLDQMKKEFEAKMIKLSDQAIQILKVKGLNLQDFSGGTRTFMLIFEYIRNQKFDINTTQRKMAEEPDAWFAKSARPEKIVRISDARDSGLMQLLREVLRLIDEEYPLYNTAREIRKNFYTLGILSDLATSVREVSKDQDVFLLSDTNHLLNGLIDEKDSPFIYEKTGQRIRHLMIDEFQDTSVLQWSNFLPLIINALSEENLVMVVGDVKQSIYRWRNGDWTLLAGRMLRDLPGRQAIRIPLQENYRSRKELIEFNSALFKHLASNIEQFLVDEDESKRPLPEDISITHAYDDAIQSYPSGKKSEKSAYVGLNFMDSADEQSWRDAVPELLTAQIRQLQDLGYRAGDIAILTKTGADGKTIANHLITVKNSEPADSKYNFTILSVDALELQSSRLVCFVMDTIRFVEDSNNDPARIAMIEYLSLQKGFEFAQVIQPRDKTNDFLNPLGYDSAELMKQLRFAPPANMVDRILLYFGLSNLHNEKVFLDAFIDWINSRSSGFAFTNRRFIELWEEEGSKVKISMPAGSDAIQILTIHKSKGMEYEVVLIPFADWSLDHKASFTKILWCSPKVEPFNQLQLIPLQYSKSLAQTIFREEYLREKIQNYVDNLNLLYVAYTRAKSVLISYMPVSKEKKSSSIASFIHDFALKGPATAWNQDRTLFRQGELIPRAEWKEQSRIFHEIKQAKSGRKMPELRFRHSYRSAYTEIEGHTQRDRGLLFHQLLSGVFTADQLEHAVDDFVEGGLISSEEGKEFLLMMYEGWKRPEISRLFSPHFRVKTEAAILVPPGKLKIPDRILMDENETIVVDFKFGQKSDSHHRQIGEYMQLLQSMGYPGISGKIYYVTENELIDV